MRKTGADKTRLKICFNWGPTSNNMGIFDHILASMTDEISLVTNRRWDQPKTKLCRVRNPSNYVNGWGQLSR